MNAVRLLAYDDAVPMPDGRWVNADGIRTRVFEAGSGAPIVFIYGGNFGTSESASSAYTWNLQLAPLAAAGYRAIAFDKLGQGETDNPRTDADYTMAAVVQHAADTIRALDLPPVHLVGHSRGAFAATRLALDHHDLVRSVTIVNTGTLSPRVGTNEVVLSRPPHPRGSREGVRWVYERYSFNARAVTDAWVDSVMATLALPKYQESVRRVEGDRLGARLFLPQLARLKAETLQWLAAGRLQRPAQVVWGLDDATAAVEGGYELYQMLARHEPDARFHVINASGHFPFREHPARFNALLAAFVAGVEAR